MCWPSRLSSMLLSTARDSKLQSRFTDAACRSHPVRLLSKRSTALFFRAWHTSLFCFLFFLSASLCSKVSPPLLTAAKHNKAASQWAQVVSKFNAALKEIGDVENWAERLEDDMHTIVDTLEYIHRGAQGSAGWGEERGGAG